MSAPSSADEHATAAPGVDHDPLRVSNLTHHYPQKRSRKRGRAGETVPATAAEQPPALHDVSLTVAPGEIFGLLGPNGSGKSTLFRIICTLLRPTAGSVTVFGQDPFTNPAAVRAGLGVVFQSPSLDGKLTARENLLHQGRLYAMSGEPLRQRIDALLQQFGLLDRADDHVEKFSGGMRRRVELAKALLHDPQLLLMDEPATGLDPGARLDMWQQIRNLRQRGMTVVLTTHLMEEADRCDRLAILARGEVVTIDTPAALKARIGGDVITVSTSDADLQPLADAIRDRFAPWPGDDGAPVVVDTTIRMEKPDGAAFVAELTRAFGDRITRVSVGQPTLDDVFLHLTGHTLWDDAEQ